MKRKILVLVLASLFVLAFRWFFTPEAFVYSGEAMGTTYSITAYGPRWIRHEDVSKTIDLKLAELTQVFSTYETESVISLFNRAPVNQPIPVPRTFRRLYGIAVELWEKTEGRWDPTIYPLFELWGFMSAKPSVPSDADIARVQRQIGFDAVALRSDGTLVKSRPVQLDFSSIAKGYGVDQLSEVLTGLGISSFLVEIGGEVRVSHSRPNGKPWRVGINTPRSDASSTETVRVIEVSHQAVATSGDYRHFFLENGEKYSHILDPTTGRPVASRVVSVTIVASTCALADGLATAAMVMGQKQTESLLKRHYPTVQSIFY